MCPAATLLLCFLLEPGPARLIKSLSPKIDHMLWGIDSDYEHWCPWPDSALCLAWVPPASVEGRWQINAQLCCLICWNWDASQVRVTLSIKRQKNWILGIWYKINKYFSFSYQQEGYPVFTRTSPTKRLQLNPQHAISDGQQALTSCHFISPSSVSVSKVRFILLLLLLWSRK